MALNCRTQHGRRVAVILPAVAACPAVALAQVNCEAMAPGPARTDCYIGLGRINQTRATMATDAAQRSGAPATLRKYTGGSAHKPRRTKSR
jgi:hypothetical protein